MIHNLAALISSRKRGGTESEIYLDMLLLESELRAFFGGKPWLLWRGLSQKRSTCRRWSCSCVSSQHDALRRLHVELLRSHATSCADTPFCGGLRSCSWGIRWLGNLACLFTTNDLGLGPPGSIRCHGVWCLRTVELDLWPCSAQQRAGNDNVLLLERDGSVPVVPRGVPYNPLLTGKSKMKCCLGEASVWLCPE